ncbi:MAG: hypothetical protein V4631_20945 [Pseudomonadota bacterium]
MFALTHLGFWLGGVDILSRGQASGIAYGCSLLAGLIVFCVSLAAAS